MVKANRRKGTIMSRTNQGRVALVLVAVALLIAAMVCAAKASASEVVRGEGWQAISATLAPRAHVRLTCPAGWRGTGMDVATVRPSFALAHGVWIDGGEAMAFYARYRVALARPSQTYGLSAVAFKSYMRTVAVEVICER
jgi:hypothetical protein